MKGSEEVQKTIREIAEKIWREYQPEKIILFGSYAYGKPTEDSDIDLLIIKDTDDARQERWMRVRRIIRGVTRFLPVSPQIYSKREFEHRMEIGDLFLLREVLAKGEVLYG